MGTLIALHSGALTLVNTRIAKSSSFATEARLVMSRCPIIGTWREFAVVSAEDWLTLGQRQRLLADHKKWVSRVRRLIGFEWISISLGKSLSIARRFGVRGVKTRSGNM